MGTIEFIWIPRIGKRNRPPHLAGRTGEVPESFFRKGMTHRYFHDNALIRPANRIIQLVELSSMRALSLHTKEMYNHPRQPIAESRRSIQCSDGIPMARMITAPTRIKEQIHLIEMICLFTRKILAVFV